MKEYKYIVVGAGLSGVVAADQIAKSTGEKVLIIEKRSFVGGNCYDYYQDNGILVQKYGPHIFHTNNKAVFEYLSNYTEWHNYELEVKSSIGGKIVPIPFNINTIEMLFSKEEASKYIEALEGEFGKGNRVSIHDLKKSNNELVAEIANYIFENSFKNYILKQWGRSYETLDRLIVDRIPVNLCKDNRYFMDEYQGVPKDGFASMIEKIVENPLIDVKLNADFFDYFNITDEVTYKDGNKFDGKLIYTGAIDEFLGYKHGKLPYRSLKFKFETKEIEDFQEAAVISYPNEFDYTRITEIKKLTKQVHENTTLIYEYPFEFDLDDEELERYYPIPQVENTEMYMVYKKEMEAFKNVVLLGRLAEYKYYNMDQIVANALKIMEIITEEAI